MSNLWTDIRKGAHNIESDIERGFHTLEDDFSKLGNHPLEGISDIGRQLESGTGNIVKKLPGGRKIVKGSRLIESDVKNIFSGGLSNLSVQLDSGLKQIWNNVKNEIDDLKDHISTNQNNITVAATTAPAATVAATTIPAATVAATTIPASTVAATALPGGTVKPDDSNYDLASNSASVIPVMHSDEPKLQETSVSTNLPTIVSKKCLNCIVPETSSPGIITSFANIIKSHEGIIVITIVVVLLLLLLIHIR